MRGEWFQLFNNTNVLECRFLPFTGETSFFFYKKFNFRFIFTGHANGGIQMWDLTTALELFHKDEPVQRNILINYQVFD